MSESFYDLIERTECGFYRELIIYSPAFKDRNVPAPVSFGPTVQEGIPGRLKRILSDCAHSNIRDQMMRAKVVSGELYLKVPPQFFIDSLQSVIGHIRSTLIEITVQRKKRIGKERLHHLIEHVEGSKKIKRSETTEIIQLMISYGDLITILHGSEMTFISKLLDDGLPEEVGCQKPSYWKK